MRKGNRVTQTHWRDHCFRKTGVARVVWYAKGLHSFFNRIICSLAFGNMPRGNTEFFLTILSAMNKHKFDTYLNGMRTNTMMDVHNNKLE